MACFRPFIHPQNLRLALKATSPVSTLSPFVQHACKLPAPASTATIPQRLASSASRPSPEKPAQVPEPTPFVPDVETFLTVIGRGLSQHASKIPSWEALFTLTSSELAELGVEPPRARRYLLQWRQRFRNGQFGIGGDFRHVGEGGVADLRILEVPASTASSPKRLKYIVNVPPGTGDIGLCPADQMSRVRGYKVQGAKTIVGPFALPLKGGEGACVKVTKGMWEDRRGHKIDGGERRRTEVRRRRLITERREAREAGE